MVVPWEYPKQKDNKEQKFCQNSYESLTADNKTQKLYYSVWKKKYIIKVAAF